MLAVQRLSYNSQAGCTISRPAAEKTARLPLSRAIIPTQVPTLGDIAIKGLNMISRGIRKLLGHHV